MSRFTFLVLLVVISTKSCESAVVPVACCNTTDIQTAISTAPSGSSITLAPGNFSGPCGFSLGGAGTLISVVGRNTTITCTSQNGFYIQGDTDGDFIANVTLEGSATATSLSGMWLSQSSLSLYGVKLTGWGNGLSIVKSSLKVNNGVVMGSRTIAANITQSSLFLNATTVTQTTLLSGAGGYSWAVIVDSNSTCVVDGCTFFSNSAVFGSELHEYHIFTNGFLSIRNSFLNGGIGCTSGSLTASTIFPITGGIFGSWRINGTCGALLSNVTSFACSPQVPVVVVSSAVSTVAIQGGRFSGTCSGIGFLIGNSTLSCNNLQLGGFYMNIVTQGGSTLHFTASTMDSTISTSASGIYCTDSGNVVLQDAILMNSYTAIDTVGCRTSLFNATFTKNTAAASSNGLLNQCGGAARVGSAQVVSSTFTQNIAASGSGAALYAMGPSLSIYNSTFALNSCRNAGGGVAVIYGNATISSSSFFANTASDGGGVCAVNESTVVIVTFTNFSRNAVGHDGGALTSILGKLNVSRSDFTFNSAANDAGAIASGFADIDGCNFVANLAYYRSAGAVRGWHTLKNSYFERNTAVYYGGAVNLEGTGLIFNCTFRGNSILAYDGAAIYMQGTAGMSFIMNCTFESNSAGTNGGALKIGPGFVRVVGCVFSLNRASSGGAIVIDGDGGELVSSIFQDNTALSYGGIVTMRVGYLTMQNCLFMRNQASFGGVVGLFSMALGNPITVTDSTFSDNAAGSYGGCFAFQPSAAQPSVVIARSNFLRNAAVQGGAIYSAFWATIKNCTFDANSATFGGAIYADVPGRSCWNVIAATFRQNMAARDGGALFSLIVFSCTNCIGTSNIAGGYGGFAQFDGQIIALGGNYTNNSAALDGGVFNFACSSSSDIGLCANYGVFSRNAARSGGVVSSLCGYFGSAASIFDSNSAQESGGALYLHQPCLEIVTFTSNTAQYGGALSMPYSVETPPHGFLYRCIFLGNVASKQGGAIYATVASFLSTTFSTFKYNSAPEGGAVFAGCESISQINAAEYSGNIAYKNGGGLYVGAFGAVSFYSANFTANRAENGGGIYSAGEIFVCDHLLVSGNTAQKNGGGLAQFGNAVAFVRTNFTRNNAIDGGAIFCHQCQILLGNDVQIANNTATDGAALWSDLGSSLYFGAGASQFRDNIQALIPLLGAHCESSGCCSAPSLPAFITSRDCYLFGNNSCQYNCSVGFAPTAPSLQCPQNASQLVPSSLCTALQCPHLANIMNGTSDNPPLPATGDVATFSCVPGFDLRGAPSVLCVGPFWQADIPFCARKSCGVINSPVNGFATANIGFFQDVVTFSCQTGYQLFGSLTSTCSVSGWSNEPPQCAILSCTVLDAPTHGSVFSGLPVFGTVAYFSCLPGYTLVGAIEINCTLSGWSDPSPRCIPRPCGQLSAVANGSFSIDGNGGGNGDTATYSCYAGWYLVGTFSRMCVFPNWTGVAPECEAVSCAPLQLASIVGCEDAQAFNGSCSVHCAPGFEGVTGAVVVRCGQPAPSLAGQYQPALPNCTQCGSGRYSPSGLGNCTACPNGGTTASETAIAQSECLCASGYYEATPSAGDCILCVAGGVCDGAKTRPFAAPGYYDNGTAIVACIPASNCLGNNRCDVGYAGTLCSVCARGYYTLNGRCKECPSSPALPVLLIIIVGLAAGVILLVAVKPTAVSERTHGLVSLTIGLSFVQIIATFSQLRVNWPPIARKLYEILSSFNLNIELASPECYAHLTFYSKFQIQMFIPAIAAGFLALGVLTIVLYQWVRAQRPPFSTMLPILKQYFGIAVAGFLYLLSFIYLLLAQAVFSVFACTTFPDGTYALVRSPGDLCGTPEWIGNVVFGVLGIIVYVIGIPVAVTTPYLMTRRKFGKFVAGHSLYSNFLVHKYRDHRWFWELVVMARKLCVVVISAFFAETVFVQVSLMCVVFLLALLASLLGRPYKWSKHHAVEMICLLGSLCILFCGVVDAQPQPSQLMLDLTGTLVAIILVICVLALACCVVLEITIFFGVQRASQLAIPQHVMSFAAGRGAVPVVSLLEWNDATVVVCADGTLTVYDRKINTVRSTATAASEIKWAALCDDEVALFGGSSLTLWSLKRGALTSTVTIPNATVTCLSAWEEKIVLGSESGDIHVWTINEVDPAAPQEAFGARRVSHNRRAAFALTAAEREQQAMQVGAQKMLASGTGFTAHSSPVLALQVSRAALYTATSDTIIKWNLTDNSQLHAWKLHGLSSVTMLRETNGILCLACGPVGVRLNVATGDNHKFQWHRGSVLCVAISMDILLTGGSDGSVIACALQTGDYLQTVVEKHGHPITSISCDSAYNVLYGDDQGEVNAVTFFPQWNKRQLDESLLSCCKTLRGDTAYAAQGPTADAADSALVTYRELDELADGLNLRDVEWRVLSAAQARRVALALEADENYRSEALVTRV